VEAPAHEFGVDAEAAQIRSIVEKPPPWLWYSVEVSSIIGFDNVDTPVVVVVARRDSHAAALAALTIAALRSIV
jgi:hypothetical protein